MSASPEESWRVQKSPVSLWIKSCLCLSQKLDGNWQSSPGPDPWWAFCRPSWSSQGPAAGLPGPGHPLPEVPADLPESRGGLWAAGPAPEEKGGPDDPGRTDGSTPGAQGPDGGPGPFWVSLLRRAAAGSEDDPGESREPDQIQMLLKTVCSKA